MHCGYGFCALYINLSFLEDGETESPLPTSPTFHLKRRGVGVLPSVSRASSPAVSPVDRSDYASFDPADYCGRHVRSVTPTVGDRLRVPTPATGHSPTDLDAGHLPPLRRCSGNPLWEGSRGAVRTVTATFNTLFHHRFPCIKWTTARRLTRHIPSLSSIYAGFVHRAAVFHLK